MLNKAKDAPQSWTDRLAGEAATTVVSSGSKRGQLRLVASPDGAPKVDFSTSGLNLTFESHLTLGGVSNVKFEKSSRINRFSSGPCASDICSAAGASGKQMSESAH